MTKAWNQLDETIRYIGSLSDFKRHLAKDDGKTPSYYYNGNRKSQILMSKLRMECSQLDSHLYRHHLLESSAFESCGHYAEDTEHYLFHCPQYDNIRHMLDEIDPTVDCTVKNFLFGAKHANLSLNHKIINSVISYIKASNRFG